MMSERSSFGRKTTGLGNGFRLRALLFLAVWMTMLYSGVVGIIDRSIPDGTQCENGLPEPDEPPDDVQALIKSTGQTLESIYMKYKSDGKFNALQEQFKRKCYSEKCILSKKIYLICDKTIPKNYADGTLCETGKPDPSKPNAKIQALIDEHIKDGGTSDSAYRIFLQSFKDTENKGKTLAEIRRQNCASKKCHASKKSYEPEPEPVCGPEPELSGTGSIQETTIMAFFVIVSVFMVLARNIV